MEYKVSKHAKLTTIILVVVGLLSLVAGIAMDHNHHGVSGRLWANLLVDGYFFFTISLAAVFFLALQYVSEMAWGVTTQRVFQAIMAFMPVGAVVLLIVFAASSLHMNHLYHWMAEGVMEEGHENYDKIIAGKSAYLNQPFFWVRTIHQLPIINLLAQKWESERCRVGGSFNGKKKAFSNVEIPLVQKMQFHVF